MTYLVLIYYYQLHFLKINLIFVDGGYIIFDQKNCQLELTNSLDILIIVKIIVKKDISQNE
jgi:hypothetical protein